MVTLIFYIDTLKSQKAFSFHPRKGKSQPPSFWNTSPNRTTFPSNVLHQFPTNKTQLILTNNISPNPKIHFPLCLSLSLSHHPHSNFNLIFRIRTFHKIKIQQNPQAHMIKFKHTHHPDHPFNFLFLQTHL
jgi:hypothetical protein